MIDSGRSCTFVSIIMDVAQSGHLYVFFICTSYQIVIHRFTHLYWFEYRSYPQVYPQLNVTDIFKMWFAMEESGG